KSCDYLASCRAGCAGRRKLLGRLDEPDPYCPVARAERITLRVRLAEGRRLAKSDSACTTVVIAR
ncbi:MAG: radical SAM protein, partial [Rhodomicrobium sp.]